MEHSEYPHPNTHMSLDDVGNLVRVLQAIPSNIGFLISHCIEPPHTPGVFGGYHALVVLPGSGGRGEADENNPAKALLKALALAHADAAAKLRPIQEELPT